MPYATKISTLTGSFANGVTTGGTLTDNGVVVPTTNFRATVLSGIGLSARGLFSVDAVLPTAGTRNLVFTPTGMGGNAVPGTFTARVRPASEAYQVPALIPLGLYPHAPAPAGTLIESKPGFAKGHLGSTQHLVVTVDGVPVQVQQDGESLPWDDGSVWVARTVFALPAALPANAEKRMTVGIANGAPNRTPWITPAALVAAHDFTIVGSGGELGAGTLTASLRQIVTTYPQDIWGDNPMGGWHLFASGPLQVGICAWRYLDAWRKAVLYVTANSDGTHDFAARVEQPNYNGPAIAGAATQTRLVAAWEGFKDGVRLGAWGGANDPRVVTVPASSFTAAGVLLQSAVPGIENGTCIVLTPAAGGVLPSGLTAGTPYWVALAITIDFLNLTLHATRQGAGSAQGPMAFGTAGSGGILVTPMISTHAFLGPLFCATDGRPVRVGGGRVDIGISWDEDYISRGAKLFPCYPQDASLVRYPSQGTPRLCWPQQAPYGFWLNTVGDDPGDERIGIVTQASVMAWLLPYDAGFQQNMRMRGVGWSDQPIWVGDTSGGRMIVVDNGPDDAGARYPGMGLVRQGKFYNGYQSGPDSSVGNWHDGGYFDGYSNAMMEGSHMPVPWVMAAFMTGHPMFDDQGAPQANTGGALYSSITQTIGARSYYTIVGEGQQLRGSGWVIRAYDYAEAFTPATRPEAAVIKKALDGLADWGAHCVLVAGASDLHVGRVGHLKDTGNDVGFFFHIFMSAVCMSAWRGRRPAMRTYAAGLCNQLLGTMNDARADGGSVWVHGGYHPHCVNAQGVAYSSIRAMIGAETEWGGAAPPFPATGFQPVWGGGDNSFETHNAFQTTGALLLRRVAVALAKSASLVSLDGDDAGLLYDAMTVRMNTAPCIGLTLSSPNWGSSRFANNTAFPVFGIVPG